MYDEVMQVVDTSFIVLWDRFEWQRQTVSSRNAAIDAARIVQ
jgi:hypothetical protein